MTNQGQFDQRVAACNCTVQHGWDGTNPDSCLTLHRWHCEVFFIDSIDSASCGKGPMPLSHFRIQASKAHINKPPKTSVWRVCPRREIPPALLPLLILPLLVYVALSLLCSLPLLQTASNWHLKIQFWRQGRSHRLGVRTRTGGCAPSPPPLPPGAEADGRSVTPFCSSLPSLIHM